VSSSDDAQFNALVFKCIDAGLSIFGDSTRRLLYYLTVSRCSLHKEDLPIKAEQLADCLRKNMGEAGGRLIEIVAIREIQKTFGISVPKGSTLSEAIKQARGKFLTC
jgi:hypothetical protein